MEAYPCKQVEFNREDLCKTIRAGPHPSTLGRCLRKSLFGEDGLTKDMIESDNSPCRGEAEAGLAKLFDGYKDFFS